MRLGYSVFCVAREAVLADYRKRWTIPWIEETLKIALTGGLAIGAWNGTHLVGMIKTSRMPPVQFQHVLSDLTVAVASPRTQLGLVGVIGLILKHHLTWLDIGKQFDGCLYIVDVARRNDALDRQAMFIGQSMDFLSKATPASSTTSIRVAFFKVGAE
jgi:hypothetical protein